MRLTSPVVLALLTACDEPKNNFSVEPIEATSDRERGKATIEPEHEIDETGGLQYDWVGGPRPGSDLWLASPTLSARLTNLESDRQIVTVQVVGDAGTPDRRFGRVSTLTLAPGKTATIPVDFGFLVDPAATQAGALSVQVQRCPAAGGPCQVGLMPALYHHTDPASGKIVVYDAPGLCERHGCGDLTGQAMVEPGMTRLLGGIPKPGVVLGEDIAPPDLPPQNPGDVLSGVWDLTVCLAVDVLITDAGLTANGQTEDYWVGAADPTQYLVRAHGFRARVTRLDEEGEVAMDEVFDADPDTGCFSFLSSETSGYQVTAYAYATDSAGNVTRVHDAGTDTSSWYPGNTLSVGFVNQSFDPDSENWLVIDGRTDDQWTTAAIAAFAMHRFHDGHSGVTLSFGWASSCSDSGSTHGDAENYIESDNAHLIRIGRCAGNIKTDTREKMLVTHEMGHAMLRLLYGYNGNEAPRDENWWDQGLVDDGTLNLVIPPNGKGCYLTDKDNGNVPYGGSYSFHTIETNSQAFKEGYADFWSARVWNAREEGGTYVYREDAFDLETWDTWGAGGVTWGGFTSNYCGLTGDDADDVSTKGDWLRFLWDVYTDPGCDDPPTRLEMMELYVAVREAHRNQTFLLTPINWDSAMMNAISNSGLDSCIVDKAVNVQARWNGI